MYKIVVHQNVDLDAAACVAFSYVGIDEVGFLSASAAEIPEEFSDADILDHPLGDKGKQERDGTVHCAAMGLPSVQDISRSALLREIDLQDTQGGSSATYNLSTILSAVRSLYFHAGVTGEELDRKILKIMVPILQGLSLREKMRLHVEELADNIRIEDIAGYLFAVFTEGNTVAPGIKDVLHKRGVIGQVYQNYNNIGVTLFPRRFQNASGLNLTCLEPHLPGWFVHTGGFLAAWGTHKAPAKKPAPFGTPRTVDELITFLRAILKKKKSTGTRSNDNKCKS